MLSHEQKIKISNPHYNQHYVTVYWNTCYHLEELTEKQNKLLQVLADMTKKEQNNYVIIDDELVLAPTNVKQYSKTPSTGVWQRNKRMDGNNRKDK